MGRNRKRRKKIAGLEAARYEHEMKLRENPTARSVSKWEKEIAHFRQKISKLKGELPGRRRRREK